MLLSNFNKSELFIFGIGKFKLILFPCGDQNVIIDCKLIWFLSLIFKPKTFFYVENKAGNGL